MSEATSSSEESFLAAWIKDRHDSNPASPVLTAIKQSTAEDTIDEVGLLKALKSAVATLAKADDR